MVAAAARVWGMRIYQLRPAVAVAKPAAAKVAEAVVAEAARATRVLGRTHLLVGADAEAAIGSVGFDMPCQTGASLPRLLSVKLSLGSRGASGALGHTTGESV